MDKRSTQNARRRANRRFARATGYTAKGSHLGELTLMECFIDQHVKEIKERAEYLERIARGIARIREEIKANKAV